MPSTPPPVLDLGEIASKSKKLKPTATVVRDRNGTVCVEREELLSASEKERKVSFSIEAGKIRGEQRMERQHMERPVHHGRLYEFISNSKDNWKDGTWKMSAVETTSQDDSSLGSVSKPIKIVTFNVWFSPHEWKKRTDALVDLLVGSEQTDLICLQEVTSRVLDRILELQDVRKFYRITDQPDESGYYQTLGCHGYGLAMLIRRTLPVIPAVAFHELPTRMGRSVLVASFGGGQEHRQDVAVATVHLESLASRALRAQQLQAIHTLLEKHATAVLVGDYNITATGPHGNPHEHASVGTTRMPDYEDVWVREHGTDGDDEASPGFGAGITFDAADNGMLRRLRVLQTPKTRPKPPDRARYDRVLVKTTAHGLDARKIRILGNEPIAGVSPSLYISDHYGLAFELSAPEADSTN